MARTPLALMVIVGAGAIAAGAGLLHLNFFRDFDEISPAVCTPVVGVPGVEDAVADPVSGLAWLSSMERQPVEDEEDGPLRGAIMAFDTDNPLDISSWQDRTGGVPADFRPLGISVYRDAHTHRLFVANEADASVLVYAINPNGNLALIDTLHDQRLTSPNAIVAVGPKAFYVTNSTPFSHGSILASANFVTPIGSGSILYYDGNSWSEAANGLRFANGLAINGAGDRLYVSETAAKRIRVFSRDPKLGYLQPETVITLQTFPDNLRWAGDDTLLVGTIPKPLGFTAFADGGEEHTPSRLLKIDPGTRRVEVVFSDDGARLSGLTVGARIAGKLLLGAFAENKFLLCDSPVPGSDS